MADQKNESADKVAKSESIYTKQQFVESDRYQPYRDIVAALLQDEKEYSKSEVDAIISDFLKEER